MTEAYHVPNNFTFYLVQCIDRCNNEVSVLERNKKCINVLFYAVNIPLIVVGSLSVFLPAIVPTIMSAVQGVYTSFNVSEKKVDIERRIQRLQQLVVYLEREHLFNIESKIGRYFNGDQIVEIKTDDDFEEYILFIEKYVDNVFTG